MKTIVSKGLALLVLAFISHGSAMAVERLSAAELASHCAEIKTNPEGVDGIFCIRCIHGFIYGAVATDLRGKEVSGNGLASTIYTTSRKYYPCELDS